MLEYQKSKLLEKYSKHILKLEPFLLRISGYNPEETRLKIDNYHLHCTPATFTMTSATLVLFLGKNEIGFFKKFEKKLVSLNLAFDSTYFGSAISFYIKGKMESLTMMRENVYTMEFTLNNVPDAYKEIFLYLSDISTLYKKLYSTKLNETQITGIKKLPIKKAQVFKDGVLICHGTVANISTKHIELDLRQNSIELEMDTIYKYTIIYNGRAINLSGKVVKSQPNQYISSLDFNIEYIHILSKYMNMAAKNQISDKQDVEELEVLEEL